MLLTLNFVLLNFIGVQEIIVIVMVLGFLGIIPFIFYLITLQNTFYAISPANRQMTPGQVWLLLIPFFNLVWQFIVVNKLSESLRAEFAARNIPSTEAFPGRTIGMAYCILGCCSVIPVLGSLAALAALVCWIIFWVKMHDCKIKIQQAIASANL